MLAVYQDVELSAQFEWTTVHAHPYAAAPSFASNDNRERSDTLGFERAIVAALAIALLFWGAVGAALRCFF